MGRPPGTTVFVGNISYDTTEDQLKEFFSQAGNVVSFRLMYDHDTGRAKGFGFCEYEDKETAMSARRNLNGTELNGRPLRVDLTDSDKQAAAANGLSLTPDTQPKSAPSLSKSPAHPAIPASLASANPSMATMTPAEIHAAMLHLKKAVVTNRNELRDLLLANPRLAHAILHGQIMLGMVPPPMPIPPQPPRPGQSLPTNPGMPPGPRAPPQPVPPQRPPPQRPPPAMQVPLPAAQPMPPAQSPQPPHPAQMPARPGMGPPPQGPPANPAQAAMMQQNMARQRPPMHMPGPGPGPGPGPQRIGMQQQAPPPQQQQQQQGAVDDQEAILRRVMAMTQQEIDALQPEHRTYVLQLKEIVTMQQGRGMQPGMQPGQQQPPAGPGQYR